MQGEKLVVLKDQELLLCTSIGVEAQNFREIEGSGNRLWRWALGDASSVSFTPLSKKCRVHYRIMVPVAGTKILVHHENTLCLSLEAKEPETIFKGFFEFAPTNEKEKLCFTLVRDDPSQLHPVDPSLSFCIQQFFLVSMDTEEDFSEEKLPLKPIHFTCVAIPTWTTFVPPMGIAYIAEAVREAGFTVSVFDYNITAWHILKNKKADGKNLWSYHNAELFREVDLFEKHILPHLRESMDKLVNDICATNPSVIGFTLYYTTFACFRYLAKACKARLPEVKIVCGGPGVVADYIENFIEEMSDSAMDAAVVGEGEATIVELLRRWAHGKSLDGCKGVLHKRKEGFMVTEAPRAQLPYASLPFPSYSDFNLNLYDEPDALPVMMSRGCVARCTFCSETRFWAKFRFDPAERTFHQISSLLEKHGGGCAKYISMTP